MQSRRDQVHAYSHQVSRLTSALVEADPDSLEPPTRRVSRGIRGGVAVASLIAAVVFGVALFTPPSNAVLRQAGALFVQKDTGGRYLVRDGVLHPVRNMTSARLILGSRMTTTTVSAKAVASLPHGEPIGVAGWPDDLPPAALLNRGVWRTCSIGAASPSDADAPVLSTVVGAVPSTGRLGGGDALLVAEPSRDGGSTLYLLWRGRRLQLADSAVRDALGYAAVEPAPVTSDWLGLIPEGPVLMAPQVAGRGEPGPALGGTATVIGDIVEVRTGNGEGSHFVVTGEGLAALNHMQYLLASTQSGPPLQLGVDGLAGAARTTLPLEAALPATPPAVPQELGSRVPCAELSLLRRASATVVTEPRPIGTPRQRQLTAASGGGALVGLLDANEQDSQVFLVDGSAQAYPVADTQALTALGYDQRQVVGVPRAFLALLPQGPSIRRIDVEGV